MSGAGDNSRIADFYAEWEREELARELQQGRLKELFAEAKKAGFNTKALRAAFRQQFDAATATPEQTAKRKSNDADTELYLSALARVRTREGDEHAQRDPVDRGPPRDASASGRAARSRRALGITPSVPAETRDPSAAAEPASDESSAQIPESTAARMDVRGSERPANLRVNDGDSEPQNSPDIELAAGTQAPPVDTFKSAAQQAVDRVQAERALDRTKPHPACQDPTDCGVNGSWNHMCLQCAKAWKAGGHKAPDRVAA